MCVFVTDAMWQKVKQQPVAQEVIDTYLAQHPEAALDVSSTEWGIRAELVNVHSRQTYARSTEADRATALRMIAAYLLGSEPTLLNARTGASSLDLAQRARELVGV